MKSKFLQQARTSKLQLALCPVTGLSITIEVPVIPNKVLTYQNPLALPINAIGIAKLSYKEKAALGNTILAGSLLSLLTHYRKVSDHLSAVQRNELLSICSTYQLHSLLSAFATTSKSIMANWPKLSFEAIDQYSVTSTIQNYLDLITGKTVTTGAKVYSVTTTTAKKVKKQKNVSSELRQRMKFLISEISTLFPAKIIQICQITAQGNNLYSLNEPLRNKLVAKLQTVSSIHSMELADIISNAAQNEEDITQHFSESRPVKSLKEILAEKTGKPYVEEQQPVEEQEPAQKPEDLFFPSFKHGDCENCEYEMSSCKQLGYCYILIEEKQKEEFSILGEIKAAAEELGYETPNLEYIEEEDEDDSDQDSEDEQLSEDDEAAEDGEAEEAEDNLSEEEAEDDDF